MPPLSALQAGMVELQPSVLGEFDCCNTITEARLAEMEQQWRAQLRTVGGVRSPGQLQHRVRDTKKTSMAALFMPGTKGRYPKGEGKRGRRGNKAGKGGGGGKRREEKAGRSGSRRRGRGSVGSRGGGGGGGGGGRRARGGARSPAAAADAAADDEEV